MSSRAVTQLTPMLDPYIRRRLACRRRIFGATTAILDESSYAALSMPAVAHRARVNARRSSPTSPPRTR